MGLILSFGEQRLVRSRNADEAGRGTIGGNQYHILEGWGDFEKWHDSIRYVSAGTNCIELRITCNILFQESELGMLQNPFLLPFKLVQDTPHWSRKYYLWINNPYKQASDREGSLCQKCDTGNITRFLWGRTCDDAIGQPPAAKAGFGCRSW